MDGLSHIWKQDEIKYLIELYKKHRILYDMTNRLYTNKKARDNAISKLSREMSPYRPSTMPSEVKEQIRILRAQFTAERHAHQQFVDSGVDQEYTPKLWCYDLLHFLEPSSVHYNDSNTASNNIIEYDEDEFTAEIAIEDYLSDHLNDANDAPAVPQKPKRKGRRDEHERYRDRQNNVDNIEMIDMSSYFNRFKGKKGLKRLKKKQEKAFAAIQIAKQFAVKYTQKQKTSKNLMFSNFICDELDDIKHEEVLDEVKWEIQEVVRNALKRDKVYLRQDQDRTVMAASTTNCSDVGTISPQILYNLEM